MNRMDSRGFGQGGAPASAGADDVAGAEGGKDETIKSMLAMLGFPPARIQAGLDALNGRAPQLAQPQPQAVARPVDEPLLTPQELCERLKISITSLWRLKPPCLKVRGRKRFCWSEIKEFLASREAMAMQA